jgi:uncharacterized protein YgiM (DUF1202 family)
MQTGMEQHPIVWRTPTRVGAVLVAILGWLWLPAFGAAQEATCTECTVYTTQELNLRQDPSQDSAVLRIIPAGTELSRAPEADVEGYTPVTYDNVPGWVVSVGLETPSKGVGAASTAPEPATTEEAEPTSEEVEPASVDTERVTLDALTLRSGPAIDTDAILIMPEGSIVTLTGEGSENGYVIVDFEGETGWAYADYLSEVSAQ